MQAVHPRGRRRPACPRSESEDCVEQSAAERGISGGGEE